MFFGVLWLLLPVPYLTFIIAWLTLTHLVWDQLVGHRLAGRVLCDLRFAAMSFVSCGGEGVSTTSCRKTPFYGFTVLVVYQE
jgi:hypothetical protein